MDNLEDSIPDKSSAEDFDIEERISETSSMLINRIINLDGQILQCQQEIRELHSQLKNSEATSDNLN